MQLTKNHNTYSIEGGVVPLPGVVSFHDNYYLLNTSLLLVSVVVKLHPLFFTLHNTYYGSCFSHKEAGLKTSHLTQLHSLEVAQLKFE